MTSDTSTVRTGVMGWPVSHSLSPRLHGYWLDLYGIDGSYVPLPVSPDDLEQEIRALPVQGFAGVNLTVPLKEAVIPFLDYVSPDAQKIGAVNMVTVNADGSLQGDNTDGYGFIAALEEAAPDWKASPGPATVIGAGGASRAILAALIGEGISEIRLANRTRGRADALAEEFGKTVSVIDWGDRLDVLGDSTLLVNTTRCGMNGEDPLDLALETLNPAAVVNDIVYVPLKTPLLAEAQNRGNVIVDGLGMLLHQARPAFAAWFGKGPNVTAALRDHVLGSGS